MSASVVAELIARSSFIFSGTITSTGQSSVDVLPAQPGLAVVRFNRGFLVNPVLGDLAGSPITVRLAQAGAGTGAVRQGQQWIFFTQAWVHGKEIAVSEIGRLTADSKTEEDVVRAIAALPKIHLQQRIASASLVVQGQVLKVERAADVQELISEHAPRWMRATIEVSHTLKGAPSSSVVLYFPSSGDRAYASVPRPARAQAGIFLLHAGKPPLPPGALIAPDVADIQPDDALNNVEALLSGGRSP